VAGCCECGDEPSGSCVTELVSALRWADPRPRGPRNGLGINYELIVNWERTEDLVRKR
jgi:hypothetical protein